MEWFGAGVIVGAGIGYVFHRWNINDYKMRVLRAQKFDHSNAPIIANRAPKIADIDNVEHLQIWVIEKNDSIGEVYICYKDPTFDKQWIKCKPSA